MYDLLNLTKICGNLRRTKFDVEFAIIIVYSLYDDCNPQQIDWNSEICLKSEIVTKDTESQGNKSNKKTYIKRVS